MSCVETPKKIRDKRNQYLDLDDLDSCVHPKQGLGNAQEDDGPCHWVVVQPLPVPFAIGQSDKADQEQQQGQQDVTQKRNGRLHECLSDCPPAGWSRLMRERLAKRLEPF